MKTEKTLKIIYILPFIIAIIGIIGVNRNVIFQRGNPLPYMAAAAKITEDQPFYPVKNSDSDTYISDLDLSDEEFIEFAENKLDSRFISQEGSVYVFSSGDKTVYVDSEIYMGKYKLWNFPKA